jgi:hypothetical protein
MKEGGKERKKTWSLFTWLAKMLTMIKKDPVRKTPHTAHRRRLMRGFSCPEV